MRLVSRIRAWYWRRRWVRHALDCRLCLFAAEGALKPHNCCELGGLTVRLAAHWQAVVNGGGPLSAKEPTP